MYEASRFQRPLDNIHADNITATMLGKGSLSPSKPLQYFSTLIDSK